MTISMLLAEASCRRRAGRPGGRRRASMKPWTMPIQAPLMACTPSMGEESGCQLVPEPSRVTSYGPRRPAMPIAASAAGGASWASARAATSSVSARACRA